jgi:HK97 family phage major capsid protein
MNLQILLIAFFALLCGALWLAAWKRLRDERHTAFNPPWPWWARWRPRWQQLTLCLCAITFLLILQNGGHGANLDGGTMLLCLGVLADAEFQEKVLKGVEGLNGEMESIQQDLSAVEKRIKRYDEMFGGDPKDWPKEYRKIQEDITRLKNNHNDMAHNQELMVKHIQALESTKRNIIRGEFGSPAARISADPQMRARFNLAVRLAVDKKGDLVHRCEPLFDRLGLDMRDAREQMVYKALGEDSSPGSTIIDDKLGDEIYDTLSTFGIWNTFAVRRLTTKQTKWPIKTARTVTNVILTEAGTITDDANKAGTSVTLEVELLACLLNVSLQLVEDSEIDVTADVLDDFAESYAERLDHFALTAAGAANATDGGMTGVFEGGTLVAAAATEDTVEELDLEDFMAALLAVDPIVLNRQSKWWMHPHVLIRMLGIKDSSGRPIFQTAMEAPSPGAVGSILGYPVVLAFKAPSANVANTKVATFGDPAGHVMGIRTDFKFEASDEHKWNTYERSFRGVGRAGSKIRRALAFANLRLTT